MTPLPDIDVFDFSHTIAGRYCAQLFAQLGARVVRLGKIDDGAIGYGGAAGEAYGAWLDRGKTRELPAEPAPLALIIAGEDPEREREAVRAVAADPVILDISWFDAGGPYRDWAANDATMLALIGSAYGFGPADGPPVLAQGHGPQIVAGATAFIATLASLTARRRGAGAREISLSIFEAAMCFSEPNAVSYHRRGEKARRIGVNRYAPTYPCSVYRASDLWVGVTALTPAQWSALCDMVGQPQAASDPRFATTLGRLMHSEEVDRLIAPFFAGRPAIDLVLEGQKRRIPFAPVPEMDELLETQHWKERGAFAQLSDGGPLAPALPFRMDWKGPPTPLPPLESGHKPLSGVRVVDFSMGWAGPLATRHLGDLGADIIKIESEAHPDWWRGWERRVEGQPPTIELQPIFNTTNRSKRDVSIDLGSEEGQAQAKALIASADVVIESFGPGVLAKLGFGSDALRRLNPGLIFITMAPFGDRGPWRSFRAYGSTVEQASGVPTLNGEAEWPPALQHLAYGDPVAGLYAAAAALAALHGRERLGGCDIDLAQVETAFQTAADAIIAGQVTGEPLPRTGSRRPTLALCCCVRTSGGEDEWIAVAARDRQQMRALAEIAGGPDESALAEWARGLTAKEAVKALQKAGIAAAPVQPYQKLIDDAQLRASGFWLELERPFVGRHFVGAPPYRLDGERPSILRPAPTLGQHNEELLAPLRTQAEAR